MRRPKVVVFLLQASMISLELGYTLFHLLEFAFLPFPESTLCYPVLLSTTLEANRQ